MNTDQLNKCDKMIHKASRIICRKLPASIFNYVFASVDDAYQQGWLCLVKNEKVLRLADEAERNGAMIYTSIYRDLQDHVRAVVGRQTNSHRHQSIVNGTNAVVDVPSPEKTFEMVLTKEILTFLAKKLNVRDNFIANLLFVQGWTEKEIAKKFGVTEGRISQIKSAIVNKTKNFK